MVDTLGRRTYAKWKWVKWNNILRRSGRIHWNESASIFLVVIWHRRVCSDRDPNAPFIEWQRNNNRLSIANIHTSIVLGSFESMAPDLIEIFPFELYYFRAGGHNLYSTYCHNVVAVIVIYCGITVQCSYMHTHYYTPTLPNYSFVNDID